MSPFPETASLLEIVWTLETSVGLLLAILMYQFWSYKRRYLRAHRLNGARKIIVMSHLMRKGFYLLSHLGFVLAGMMAMTLSSRPRLNTETSISSWFIPAVFISAAIGMQIDMVMTYRRYRHVEEMDEDELRKELRPL